MIQQASAVSRALGISREDQDAWAVRSHERAAAAQDAGRFDDEIIPVGEVAADESIRRDTTLEKLSTLKPVFDPEGTTTAGNAPGVTDGASCVVVCSEEWAEERGLEPLARIIGHAYVADEFAHLARVPALAAEKALASADDRWATSRGWRSTRPSRRWPRTRRACWEQTRSLST